MPDGYNGLPLIRSAPATAVYSTPLTQGGLVEPGGDQVVSDQDSALQPKRIAELTANIAIGSADLPPSSPRDANNGPAPRIHGPGTHRAWNGMNFYWDASQLAHQPLYFEDVNLERNGYSCGIGQPFVSAARFFGRIPLLPYALAVHPHHEVQYALGESRPGSSAPYVHVRPPLSGQGALAQAAVVTGLFFLIP
jgi:hypothetical protein